MITRIFGTVTGGRLNLRAAADSSASILASIPNETLLVVTEHNDTWYATTYGSYTGFVMKQYIKLLDLANASELAGEVTGGALNMRRTASTSADRLIQIPNNTAITVIDFDADSQWYITDYNGYTGYVMKQYVTVTQPVLNWAYGQVNVAELNVRREPSTSAARWNNVWPRNRIVLIKDDVDGWYESLYRGQPAYVVKEYINVMDTTPHKCELVIHPFQRGHLADSIDRLSLCHAAIVCNAMPEDIRALEAARLPVPVVLHSRHSDVLPCVNIDYVEAGQMVADIFRRHGVKNAVLCASSSPFCGAADCEDAFFRQVLQAGMGVRRIEVANNMGGGYDAAQQIARLKERPDGVFFLSDMLALGALRGFYDEGVAIPGDMKLISIGSYDADMEEHVVPSLSVVRVPLEEMGAAAMTKALNLVTGTTEERETRLPLCYVARESCSAID